LQSGFATPAAFGDLIAVALAWGAFLAGKHPVSIAFLWLFNLWGTADLLFAFYQGLVGVGIAPSSLGATYFIPTLLVPLLLCTHVLLFILLIRHTRNQRPDPRN
jgi:hypothetical protein